MDRPGRLGQRFRFGMRPTECALEAVLRNTSCGPSMPAASIFTWDQPAAERRDGID